MSRELLAIAEKAARAGSRVLKGMWGASLTISNKSRFDFVTQADKASIEAVLGVIRAAFPDHAVLAEESAATWDVPEREKGVLWVVDPLDGTTNFIHGFPQVAVSVAALVDGRPMAGVVMDVTRGEVFSAMRGQGAWLNGKPMRVSRVTSPEKSLLLTGFPFRDKKRLSLYLELFTDLFTRVSGVRRAGAAALDLAYVAAGRAEGFWELGLSPWDVAAGALMVREAGGVVTDFKGGEGYIWQRRIVAANPHLHGMMQKACGARFPGD